MSITKVLVVLFFVVCVQSQPHPFNENLAEQAFVSVSCGEDPCSYQDQTPSLIIDGDEETFWRSDAGVTSKYQIIVTLSQEFEVTGISVTFPDSLISSNWSIEISQDGYNYNQIAFFSLNCAAVSIPFCEEISRSMRTADLSLDVSKDRRAQFIRINLLSYQSDLEPEQQFHSISEVEVYGQCSCNGFGRDCFLLEDTSTEYQCTCTGNTCGTHCEECCEGYQILDYVTRTSDPLFSCKKCDNCTNSLLQLLDSHTNTFNYTADRFDSLILTVPLFLPAIRNFLSQFVSLYYDVRDYVFDTSAIELTFRGNSSNYSFPDPVPILTCVPELSVPPLEAYMEIRRTFEDAIILHSELVDGNDETLIQIVQQQQELLAFYHTLNQFNISLQEHFDSLVTSLRAHQEIATEIQSGTLSAKSNFSAIIYNHLFISETRINIIKLLAVVEQWKDIINTSLLALTQFHTKADTIHATFRTLSIQIELSLEIANNSIFLFTEIEQSRLIILDLITEINVIALNISSVVRDLQFLNVTIYNLFDALTDLITSLEGCLYQLTKFNDLLSNRNSVLTEVLRSIEVDLKAFLNTDEIQSADFYTLQAEIHAEELVITLQAINSLARYIPNTSVILSLTEQEILTPIESAREVIIARDRLNIFIERIRADTIFDRIAELRLTIIQLDEIARNLIRESADVLNSINPHIDTANQLSIDISELRSRLEELLVRAGIKFAEDEYTILSQLRTDLELKTLSLSDQEALVNSTITDILEAKELLPQIAFYNAQTVELRDIIVNQSVDARENTFQISAKLNNLAWTTNNIQTRNSNIRSRLEKVYSRLSRVHNKLQLPKAPLRLDGSMVVSLQPPPTEQLENATYSTDFSFYFEPVRTGLSESTFLFFYAGPAILDTSENVSPLDTEDYIAIVSANSVMGYRARIGGTEFSKSLGSRETIRSNSKYTVRIKRVGSAFRFELKTPTATYTTATTLSEESLHHFAFKPTPNTAYYIGGHPDDVLIATSLQSLDKFRGCVYLALTLRWNLYSLWDTRYHTNFLTDQTGLDCIRHSDTQADFDVDGLSFYGYGHAYIRNTQNSPIVKFTVTPQEHDGLILTSFGKNRGDKKFIYSFYIRDRKFKFDIAYDGASRVTYTLDLLIKVSTRYDVELELFQSGGVKAIINYDNKEAELVTGLRRDLFKADVLLFGGISRIAVDETDSDVLSSWTTDYYRNFTGCITNVIILRTTISAVLLDTSFNFNSGGTTGVTLGCPNFPIPEYSITKTDTTGYLDFDLLVHEGVTGSFTQFYHGENNFELLPGPVGTLSSSPVDFSKSYSLGLIVSKPYTMNQKSVLIHISDLDQGLSLEVSIDSSYNATLEIKRGDVLASISSPLDVNKYRIMHSITVHSIGESGLELYVDDNTPVTLPGAFNLVLPIELSANQNLFVGGNEIPEYSFNGCLKEVALYDSLLNLGLGTFVATGDSTVGSEGIEHDMCGFHPYNGLVYGGARALPHPFDFQEAVRLSTIPK
ncbi:hypothetical protein LOD99_10145 [Oopsacas minuta]|uniref:Uncharacterized protein n=1 Tax=Oopsacas minuta TaxID=111878 RepID=A0AAV7KIL8_9METZ|nr:hypothetical protein LOD99_10145 [Oopsacas minuta]